MFIDFTLDSNDWVRIARLITFISHQPGRGGAVFSVLANHYKTVQYKINK